jgi:hypothetical protein
MLLPGAVLAVFLLLVLVLMIISAADCSRAGDIRDSMPDPIALVKNWFWPGPPAAS